MGSTVLVDIDHTLTDFASSFELLKKKSPKLFKLSNAEYQAVLRGEVSPEVGLEAVWHKLGVDGSITEKDWQELAREAVKRKEFNHGLVADLQEARHRGAKVILASLTHEHFAKELNELLGFDGFVASRPGRAVTPRSSCFGSRHKTKYDATVDKYGLHPQFLISDRLDHDAGSAARTCNVHVETGGGHALSRSIGVHSIEFGEEKPLHRVGLL